MRPPTAPLSGRPGAGASLSRQVFSILSGRIISFDLRPFDVLSEVSIAADLGVSRTPAREALLRLVDLGLVEVFPQRGTIVTPLRLPDLVRSQFLRESLEIGLLRRVFERGDPPALAAGLGAEIAVQRACADHGLVEAFYDSDEAFHRRIAEAAGLAEISAEIDRAKVHMDRFRHLVIAGIDDLGAILRQHVEIAEAVARGDPAAAEGAMEVHLRRILGFADRAVAAFPSYFAKDATLVGGPRRSPSD